MPGPIERAWGLTPENTRVLNKRPWYALPGTPPPDVVVETALLFRNRRVADGRAAGLTGTPAGLDAVGYDSRLEVWRQVHRGLDAEVAAVRSLVAQARWLVGAGNDPMKFVYLDILDRAGVRLNALLNHLLGDDLERPAPPDGGPDLTPYEPWEPEGVPDPDAPPDDVIMGDEGPGVAEGGGS